MVKRVGNLWEKVVSMENIQLAYRNAKKGKSQQRGAQEVAKNPKPYLEAIQRMLMDKTYRSSEYRSFILSERGKERTISALPFFPDRIIHWAVMQVLEPIVMRNLIPQTYASLPGRGTHQALMRTQEYVRKDDAVYGLKMDVHHFFASINKDKMLACLERRIKDRDVLWLLSEIIYGYPGEGMPIGNYTSQYFANLYLSDIDHFFKEKWHAKYYVRYMDDIIILGWSKPWLRRTKKKMEEKLRALDLELNSKWQIFPIDDRGVNFVGYRTFRSFRLLRTATKRRLIRRYRWIRKKVWSKQELTESDIGSISSYNGITKWGDCKRLARKYISPLMGQVRRQRYYAAVQSVL